jgi:antirestriction protein ArdC
MSKSYQKKDHYQEVTNKMVALLEQGVAPWRCTWSRYGMARNAVTSHIYTGINAFLMNLTGHAVPYFVTFKQAKQLGGKIRKGASANPVYFFKSVFKDEEGKTVKGEQIATLQGMGEEVNRIAFLKYYNLFNIADVEGVEFPLPDLKTYYHNPLEQCEQLLRNIPNPPSYVLKNGSQPYYSPSKDELNMPKREQFETAEDYYTTFYHELVHATGHTSRLNRESVNKCTPLGSPDYSREELIAELGASFLAAHTGINLPEITENSAAYLQGWLKALKADPKMIFKAAAEAQKAADYLTKTERKFTD